MKNLSNAAALAALAAMLVVPVFRPSETRLRGAHAEVPSAPSPSAVANATSAVDPAPLGSLGAAPVATPVVAPPLAPVRPPVDLTRFSTAAALYRKGLTTMADVAAAGIEDPIQRAGLDWLALKASAGADPVRLVAFEAAHRDWPGADWIEAVREGALYSRHAPTAEVLAAFADSAPRTAAGVLAQARALAALGQTEAAQAKIVALWRDWDLDAATEGAVMREFGAWLHRDDHKYRADRLGYAEKAQAAARAAALAGADESALVAARLEAARGPLTPGAIAAIPAPMQKDPGLLFARIQDARRVNHPDVAAAWIALAPHDAAALIDPDKWWSERRMVARELMDRGEFRRAYALCAEAVTTSAAAHVDAAFHAGWIALRFLDDPHAAARRFAEAADAAITPLAVARANYWRGRAAEALGQGEEARVHYRAAAAYPIAYYGQLAARKLGAEAPAPRAPAEVPRGDARWEATRIIDLYLQAGLDDLAAPLAYAAAQRWKDEGQLAALGETLTAHNRASFAVTFGKLATERGYALDLAAFPTNGLPSFAPLPRSADTASVLAIARQESEFIWRAASGAGAKGLMQILPSTAAYTARRAGVAYDPQRLTADPAFNLQLGAAYLGQLMDDEGGSFEAAAAAYNAGAGRVAQWVAAYGDPRKGEIDMVDWIERIPFDETRDYVQRVSENLGVYRARLSAEAGVGGTGAGVARE